MYSKDPIEEFKDWSGHGVPSDVSALEFAQRRCQEIPLIIDLLIVHDGSSNDRIETRLK